MELRFGSGISDNADEEIIPNPDNIGMGIKDGRSKLDIAYDQLGNVTGAQRIGGAIFEVELDNTHPIAFGYNKWH